MPRKKKTGTPVKRNPVARTAGKFNKAVVHTDKKKEQKKTTCEKPQHTFRKTQKKGLSFSEQREFDQMEEKIIALEAELKLLEEELVASSSDYLRLQELSALQEKVTEELEQKMKRWAELEGRIVG